MGKGKQLYTTICFGCGTKIGKYITEQGLEDALRQKGWMIFEDDGGGGIFYTCPTCIKEELERVWNE